MTTLALLGGSALLATLSGVGCAKGGGTEGLGGGGSTASSEVSTGTGFTTGSTASVTVGATTGSTSSSVATSGSGGAGATSGSGGAGGAGGAGSTATSATVGSTSTSGSTSISGSTSTSGSTGSGGAGGSVNATPLTLGTPEMGTYPDAQSSYVYSFSATKGDRLVIGAFAPGLDTEGVSYDATITDPTVLLYDTDGQTVLTYQEGGFPGLSQSSIVYVQIPKTGTYYVWTQDCNGLFNSGCNDPSQITDFDYELIVEKTSALPAPELVATAQDGTIAKAAKVVYKTTGTTGDYYDSLLGGDLQSATDTHVFAFKPPANTAATNTGARMRAEFYVQPIGTDVEGGDLSDANVKAWITDSTGTKIISQADQNNYPTNATSYSRLQLSAPVTLGSQYYLFVQNTQTAGSAAKDFYFIDHYLPAPLYDHAEAEKPDHSGTTNDTFATAETLTAINTTLFTVDGDITNPATDIDWFSMKVPTGVTQYAYQCDAARSGSGLGGFAISLFKSDGTTPIGTTKTETTTTDIETDFANLPTGVTAGSKIYMKLTAASQSATVTGTQYRCYVFFQ